MAPEQAHRWQTPLARQVPPIACVERAAPDARTGSRPVQGHLCPGDVERVRTLVDARAGPVAVLARWRHGTCAWNRWTFHAGRRPGGPGRLVPRLPGPGRRRDGPVASGGR